MKRYHLLLALLAAALLSGCTIAYAQGARVSKTIDPLVLTNDQRLAVAVALRAGEVRVTTTPSDELQATLTYDTPLARPNCRVENNGALVNFAIAPSAHAKRGALRGQEHQADLYLPQHALQALSIRLDAGQVSLDLRDADLNNVDARVGAGELLLDLRGAHSRDMTVAVATGLGTATVLLPADMNIEIVSERALGQIDYDGLSPAGREVSATAPTLTLTVLRGIGQTTLRLDD